MAQQATLYRFKVALSHVDRSVYETLDLRVACHPSETTASVLTRVLAHAFLQEEGIAFSRGGLSDPDEPALSVRSMDGRLRAWIDIGVPSAERLHKASKMAPRVVVITHKRPQLLRDALDGKDIHKKSELELYALDEALVASLDRLVQKSNDWEVTFSDGSVYVVVDGETLSGTIERIQLEA